MEKTNVELVWDFLSLNQGKPMPIKFISEGVKLSVKQVRKSVEILEKKEVIFGSKTCPKTYKVINNEKIKSKTTLPSDNQDFALSLPSLCPPYLESFQIRSEKENDFAPLCPTLPSDNQDFALSLPSLCPTDSKRFYYNLQKNDHFAPKGQTQLIDYKDFALSLPSLCPDFALFSKNGQKSDILDAKGQTDDEELLEAISQVVEAKRKKAHLLTKRRVNVKKYHAWESSSYKFVFFKPNIFDEKLAYEVVNYIYSKLILKNKLYILCPKFFLLTYYKLIGLKSSIYFTFFNNIKLDINTINLKAKNNPLKTPQSLDLNTPLENHFVAPRKIEVQDPPLKSELELKDDVLKEGLDISQPINEGVVDSLVANKEIKETNQPLKTKKKKEKEICGVDVTTLNYQGNKKVPECLTTLETYKNDLRAFYLEFKNKTPKATKFMDEMQNRYPNLDFMKTLDMNCTDYWATEEGYKQKVKAWKSSKAEIYEIDWYGTMKNSFKFSGNRLYKGFEKTQGVNNQLNSKKDDRDYDIPSNFVHL